MSVQVAYLPDPKKFGRKAGYPKPGVQERLRQDAGMPFTRVTPFDVRRGLTGHTVLVVPGGWVNASICIYGVSSCSVTVGAELHGGAWRPGDEIDT